MSKNRGQSDGRSERRSRLKSIREISNGKGTRLKVVNWGRGQIKKYRPVVQITYDLEEVKEKKIIHWIEY